MGGPGLDAAEAEFQFAIAVSAHEVLAAFLVLEESTTFWTGSDLGHQLLRNLFRPTRLQDIVLVQNTSVTVLAGTLVRDSPGFETLAAHFLPVLVPCQACLANHFPAFFAEPVHDQALAKSALLNFLSAPNHVLRQTYFQRRCFLRGQQRHPFAKSKRPLSPTYLPIFDFWASNTELFGIHNIFQVETE